MTTVLLVDDEPETLAAWEICCERDGFEVKAAGDGQAAMAVLAATAIDIVVADWRMPVMSGSALCQHIRNTPGLAGTVLSWCRPSQARPPLCGTTALCASPSKYRNCWRRCGACSRSMRPKVPPRGVTQRRTECGCSRSAIQPSRLRASRGAVSRSYSTNGNDLLHGQFARSSSFVPSTLL